MTNKEEKESLIEHLNHIVEYLKDEKTEVNFDINTDYSTTELYEAGMPFPVDALTGRRNILINIRSFNINYSTIRKEIENINNKVYI